MIPLCKTAREHEYYIYIMASLSGTLYTGITGTLFTRVMEHKAGEIEGFQPSIQMQSPGVLRAF
jgi:predicted GIY-YIG superfamily endonuclease